MRFSVTAALAAAFFILAAIPSLATAGETATTHRAGDLVAYSSGCRDAESMIAIAEHGGVCRTRHGTAGGGQMLP